jgi:hypothetical protein
MNRPTPDPSKGGEQKRADAQQQFPSWEGSGVGFSLPEINLGDHSSRPEEALIPNPKSEIRNEQSLLTSAHTNRN